MMTDHEVVLKIEEFTPGYQATFGKHNLAKTLRWAANALETYDFPDDHILIMTFASTSVYFKTIPRADFLALLSPQDKQMRFMVRHMAEAETQ